ncbi:MAG: response regulator transcription factor [Candidatus Eremiobacteraeota bacterium]|nr:response regulator transcription factor [Candidatus Eremiobacteraeota bacterium]MCW5869826.1 response regulator transcription factor [Candidatus Eremiobacteraeota bacterium]
MLVDDHPIFRVGLRTIVDSHPLLRVVAECSTAEEALLKLEPCSPDIMITDLCLTASRLDLIEQAKKLVPSLQITVVSAQNHSEDVLGAFEKGATAYLTKNSSQEEVLRALGEIVQGRSFLDAKIAHLVFTQMRKPKVNESEYANLSPREQEVLKRLQLGHTPKEIAEILHLSLSTVKTHVRNLYRKYEVSTRTQLILKALEIRE